MRHSYRPQATSAGRQAITGHVLLDERSQRRLQRRRWRRLGIALAAIAALIGIIALYWSPLLRVQEVQVVGAANVDASQVAELAGLKGSSMLNPPLQRAEARIEALPLVRSVKVEPRWPHTVRIEVVERVPWGYWRSGDTTYVIDAEGIVLQETQPGDGSPVINDLGSPTRLTPGDRVDVEAVALAQSMLERVPEALALGIAVMEYTPEAGLSLITDVGYRVVLGDSQNVEYKLAVWQAVEEELGREAMVGHVLDLRFEDRPSFQ